MDGSILTRRNPPEEPACISTGDDSTSSNRNSSQSAEYRGECSRIYLIETFSITRFMYRVMAEDSPRYPEENREIIERVFPQISELVHATDPDEVFRGVQERSTSLDSNHPSHPDTVAYGFKLAPQEGVNIVEGNVQVKIDVEAHDPATVDELKRNVPRFHEAGFNVELEGKRDTWAIVWDSWTVHPERFNDDEALRRLADRFVALVEVGHEILTE